jgi:hypothetical protein
MATAKKPAAKRAAPTVKPAAPKIEVKSTAPDAQPYKVTGRIRRDGLVLRVGDTVELTEREAFGLRGFVEPADDQGEADADPPTE